MRAQIKLPGRFEPYSISRRWRFIAAALFFTCVVSAAPPLLAQNSVTFTPPVNVSKDATGFAPQVVVDSAGNVGIAYLEESSPAFTNTLWFVRGAFTGGTFRPSSAPVQVATDVSASFSVALESACIIDLAYSAGLGPALQPTDMFFAQSNDCGATFTPINVSNGQAGSPGSMNPKLLINNGLAEVVWVASTNPSNMSGTIFYAQRKSAASFTSPAVIGMSSSSLFCFDAFTVPASGNTNAAWCDGADIWFLKSVSGAQPVKIGSGQSAQFAVDSKGNVYAAWMNSGSGVVEFSRSNGQAGTFTSPKPLFTGFSGGQVSIDRIAIDANGNIDLLLAAEKRVPLPRDLSTDTHTILSSRSTDGGNTFTDPIAITTLSCPLCGSGIAEQMAIDSNGVVDLSWEPQPGDGWTPAGFAFSRSNAQDTSFSARVPIAAEPIQGTVEIATEATNQVLLVWSNKGVFITQGSAPSDFTISAAPAIESVLPGGAGKFTLTLTATGGFSDAVTLSCPKLPSGAECAFDSSPVTPKDSGSQATLTVTTPPTLAQGNYSVTIAAASGGAQHSQDVQVAVGGIAGSVTPASATIAVAGSANFTVTLKSSGGFSGPVNLACGGAPSGINCSFVPAQVSFAANSASSTLTVQVSAKPSASMTPGAPQPLSRDLRLIGIGFVVLAATLFALGVILSAFNAVHPMNLSSGERQSAERSFVARGGLLRMTRGWGAFLAGPAAFSLVLVLAMGLLSCGGATKSNTAATTGATIGSGGGMGGTSGGGGGMGGTGGGSSITSQFTVQAQSGGATVNLGAVSITVP